MKWWVILGIVIGLLPILLATIVSLKNRVSIFNTGTGGGAYLLFLPFTIIIGLITVCVGYFIIG